MNKWGFLLLFTMVTGPGLLGVARAQTPDETKPANPPAAGVVEAVADGKIDWSKNEIRALGVGLAPKWATGVQAEALAREAAITIAERNLVKVVNGVHVASETTVQNLELENDTIKTKVEGLLKGAVILREKKLPEGAYEVVMGINIVGTTQSLASSVGMKDQLVKVMNPPPPPSDVKPEPEKPTDFTGLLIDCRGLVFNKSLCPRIIDQTGRDIWGFYTVSVELANEKGIAAFYRTPEEAAVKNRVGSKPLMLVPIRTDGGKLLKTNAVLAPAQVESVLAANSKTRFLDKLAVGFLVDE